MTVDSPVSFLLFDVDGLLLDTEIVYTKVTQKIVGRFGKVFDWSIKSNMIGRAEMDSSKYLVDALSLPISPEEYLFERNEMLQAGFKECDAMPGAERLIRHLHQHNIPIAVATSSSWSMFLLKRTRHPWFDLFDAFVSGDDAEVKHAKPAPDIFNIAAKRLNADKSKTLIFEDAPSGLAAGTSAGIRVIAIPDPNMDKARYGGADKILNSLTEFNPEDYGLPAYS